MEPVEIDIKLKQNVSEEGPKVVAELSNISSSSEKMKEGVEQTISFQKKIISELEKELSPLEAAFNKLNYATSNPAIIAERNKAAKAFMDVKSELVGEKKALEDLEKQQKSYSNKQQTIETQLRLVREEMGRLKLAGQGESETYRELEGKMKTLAIAYREVYKHQQLLSNGGAQWTGVVSGLTGLSGVLAAGAGAFGLISSESENFAKIQTKVQSLMAITIGLQQASQTLTQTSAFRIATVAKANELWAATNIKVATTLGISTAAAQVLMATITLGLSVAITGLIVLLSKMSSKSKEAANDQKKYQESLSDGIAKNMADYLALQKTYNSLGNTLAEKQKFILDNQKAFESLGVSITSVSDADNAFISQSKAFKDSILERAKAAASLELATEKIKAYYKKMSEAEKRQMSPNAFDIAKSLPGWGNVISKSYDTSKKAAEDIREKADEDMSQALKLIGLSSEATQNAKKLLSEANISSSDTIIKGTKEYWQNQQKIAELALSKLKDVQKGSKEWDAAVSLYNKATAKLQQWDIKGNNRKESEREKKLKQAAEKLKKVSVDTENETNAAVAAAVKEGLAQKLKDLKADYDKRISIIRQREDEISKIEEITGKPATEVRAKLTALMDADKAWYDSEVKKASTASKKVLDDLWSDVNTKFNNDLDNQLNEVDRYYTAQKKLLEENIVDQQELKSQSDELDSKRDKEKLIIKNNAALQYLSFEEDIELKRQEIKDKDILFESRRQQNILLIQRDFAKKRLDALLKAQSEGTPDLADDIQSASAEIEYLDYQIKKMNVARLREMASYIKAFTSSLSKFGGEFGDVVRALGDNVENLMVSLSKSSSKQDKINAGISSLSSIVDMITSQIAANKKEQESWTEAIIESKHQLSLLNIEAASYKDGNLFGVENPYARAIAGAKQYVASMIELRNTATQLESGQVQTGTKKVVSGGNVATGVGAGATIGAAVGTIVPVIGNAIGAIVGAAIGGIVGLFTRKTIPVFESLKKKYGEIYNSDTYELNPKIIADYAKLDEETKKIVDNWEEIKDKAKEAEEQMRQNFSDLAGDIGTQLSNALVAAFRNGDIYAGIDDFADYLSGTIEDIVTSLLFSKYFEQLFNDLEERFNKSFDKGGDQDIVDDLIWFSQIYKDQVSAFGEDLQKAKDTLAAQGIDIYSTSRQGSSSGIAQASQESISELSGGVYAMRLAIADIRQIHREQLALHKIMSSNLSRIAENTEYCRLLADVKNALDEINTRGVRFKS
jgi:hypothetical protein